MTGVVHTFPTGGGRFVAALGMTVGVDVCAVYVAIISNVTKRSLKCHLKIR